ncbi:glycosyltransferase [Trichloromonas sp.]|uniref:glycosyltransferase n=1 Tax=Trichloromonas sp. TaxID=3069249 RepID=UPI001D1A61F0|nr:glycosyltransferase [Syntrophaceae bacterium]MDY0268625.1 glycosyltransferase [Trichloromonas sp.]
MPESSENLTVSVVVPVYNGAEYIGDCIEALLHQDFKSDQFEIIVVNNRSTDNTQEIIDRYPVRSLYESKRGPAAARNAGIRASTAKFIAFTDADCIPHDDWLSKLIFSMTDSVCGAGGQILSYYEDDAVSTFIDQIVFRQRYNILQKNPPHITTANACYLRTSLEKIGLFDESFPFAAGEDRDIGERLAMAGGTFVFAEAAIIRHKHPQTLEGFYHQRFRHGSGQFYTVLKKYSKISLPQMLKEINSDRLINLGFQVVFCNGSKQERFLRLLQLIDSAAYTNGLIWRYFMYLCGK